MIDPGILAGTLHLSMLLHDSHMALNNNHLSNTGVLHNVQVNKTMIC